MNGPLNIHIIQKMYSTDKKSCSFVLFNVFLNVDCESWRFVVGLLFLKRFRNQMGRHSVVVVVVNWVKNCITFNTIQSLNSIHVLFMVREI